MFPKAVNGRDKIIRVNPNSCFKLYCIVRVPFEQVLLVKHVCSSISSGVLSCIQLHGEETSKKKKIPKQRQLFLKGFHETNPGLVQPFLSRRSRMSYL